MQDLPQAGAVMAAVGATEPLAAPITVFAPNNGAFEEISAVVDGLSAEEVLAVRFPDSQILLLVGSAERIVFLTLQLSALGLKLCTTRAFQHVQNFKQIEWPAPCTFVYNKRIFLQVLSGHIVASELPSSAVAAAIADASPNPAEVATLGGTALKATTEGENIIVSPKDTEIKAMVVVKDVQTCAGVVHVVDKVLVPAASPSTPTEKTCAQAVGSGIDYQCHGEDVSPAAVLLLGDSAVCEAE